MSDEENFGLDDFDFLEEEPPFGVMEDEEFLAEFDDSGETGGVSRTFKIVAGFMALLVLLLIVVLVGYAFASRGKLSSYDKTSTQIAALNSTEIAKNNATLTALARIAEVTETAIFFDAQTSTAQFLAAQTQQAVAATQTAVAATEAAAATQTAAAQQTATQEALDAAATATAEARRLVVHLTSQEGEPVGNVRVRLYQDNGDGEFNPADRLVAEGGGEATEATTAAPEAEISLAYGEVGEGTLNMGERVDWRFMGQAGDVVSLSAEAANPAQLDTYLELYGPDGSRLTSDDDSGDASNALITEFELPADGVYTVAVSSLAGQGDYRLRLNIAILPPEGEAGSAETTPVSPTPAEGAYRPHTSGEPLGAGAALAQEDGGTPSPTATPPTGDTLVDTVTSSLEGIIDFGSLEPGAYWLELDYNTLPPELQAVVPAGEPLVLQVNVPESGEMPEVSFEIGGPTPTPITPTPTGPNPIEQTATARAAFAAQTLTAAPVDILSPVPSEEVTGTLVQAGFFSDMTGDDGTLSGTNGLTVLAIAAAGLVAVVFIARKLRTSG